MRQPLGSQSILVLQDMFVRIKKRQKRTRERESTHYDARFKPFIKLLLVLHGVPLVQLEIIVPDVSTVIEV